MWKSYKDLEPIKDLKEVEYLNLSKNMLRDIQALREYRQLKRLDLSRNNLYTMDISAPGWYHQFGRIKSRTLQSR